MKNKLIFVVALLLAGLAFWMNWRYLKTEETNLKKNLTFIEVIAAKRDLSAMTVLSVNDLKPIKVLEVQGQNYFKKEDVDLLLNKRLLYLVKENDPILWTQVDVPRPRGTGLSAAVERGKRAVSIPFSGAQGVSGMVQPNDHVDILGTFSFPSPSNPAQVESVTLTLMQNVTVLAAGTSVAGQLDPGRQSAGGYSTITFSLTPREAEILVFAQQTRGQLYLSLRNPSDRNAETQLPSVNFDYIESVLGEINAARMQETGAGPIL